MLPQAENGGAVTGFRHAGISVRDMSAALDFYQRLLGFALLSDRVSPDSGRYVGAAGAAARICVLQLPGSNAQLELLEYRGASREAGSAKPVDFSVAHTSFWVRDIDALYARFVAQGVVVLAPPVTPASGRKKFYARDPDGFLLELTEGPDA